MVIVGWIIVLACVLLGYVLHHGKLGVLYQPTEYLIIAGAAVGSLIASTPGPILKMLGKQITHAITGKGKSKQEFMDLLLLMFEITKLGRTNLLGLEEHVENPDNSEIFNRYPSVKKNHHAIHFICDTMKVQISSPLSPYDLEELMDTDLKTLHKVEHMGPTTLSRMSDALPGLGIVAAVLGVVITMGKLSQGKEVIGQSVAGALVGTFLGILLCYGIAQPLAAKMDADLAEEGKFMDIIKTALIAFAKEASPKVCVEFARRAVPDYARPSFEEVDQAASNIGKG